MPKESIDAFFKIDTFFKMARNDKALTAALEASRTEETFLQTAVCSAAERGLVFTIDELRERTREARAGAELSEEALAAVAGGAIDNYLYFKHP